LCPWRLLPHSIPRRRPAGPFGLHAQARPAMAREKFREVKKSFLLSERRRNERTNKPEKDVPGGLLYGVRFRFGLPVSSSRFADCVTFLVTCFPFPFPFGLTLCSVLHAGTEVGERVNAPWGEVDGPGFALRVVNEGWAWN
jgi:hypothetical protein